MNYNKISYTLYNIKLYFVILQISKDDFDQYLGKVLAPFVNQLPDNLKVLVFENRKCSEIESNIVDNVNKDIKNKKCDDEILIKKSKEEKTSRNDDDTDDNYDDYGDEFENEETNSQMNVNDNDKNMDNKENVKKEDIYVKKVVHYNTKIDDINDEFFTFNEEAALNRIIEHRNENEMKKKKEFAVWKLKKDLENKLIDEKNVRTYFDDLIICDNRLIILLPMFIKNLFQS